MNPENIDFKSDKLFPFHFQLLDIVFSFSGILSIIYSPYLAPLLLFLGLFILTAYQGVEFNLTNKVYSEYNSFFLLKFGKWEKYENAVKIYINTSNTSQMIYTRITQGSIVKNKAYNALLKLGNGTRIFLGSKKNKPQICISAYHRISDPLYSKLYRRVSTKSQHHQIIRSPFLYSPGSKVEIHE